MSVQRNCVGKGRRRGRRLALVLAAAVSLGGAVAVVGAAPAGAVAPQQLMSLGEQIAPGSSVNSGMFSGGVTALNYYFKIELETNGDLREYKVLPYQSDSTMIWNTATAGYDPSGPDHASLASSGSFAVYGKTVGSYWRSATANMSVAKLMVYSDGDMRLVTSGGTVRWSSRWGIAVGTRTCKTSTAFTNGKVSTILSAACRLLGTPYCLGAGNLDGPTNYCGFTGIDCSGLTMHGIYDGVYDPARGQYIALDHYAYNQYNSNVGAWGGIKTIWDGKTNPTTYLKPGDLVFFHGADTPYPGHVGIYLGAGKLIDAYDIGVPVQMHTFSTSYSSGFMGSVRYW